jgi:hypothetical protein
MESAEKDVLVIKEGIRGLNEAYQEADTRVRLEMESKDSALESRITEAYQAADQSILSRVEKIAFNERDDISIVFSCSRGVDSANPAKTESSIKLKLSLSIFTSNTFLKNFFKL